MYTENDINEVIREERERCAAALRFQETRTAELAEQCPTCDGKRLVGSGAVGVQEFWLGPWSCPTCT